MQCDAMFFFFIKMCIWCLEENVLYMRKMNNEHNFFQIHLTFETHLCNLFKVFMSFLQSSGSVQRLPNTSVFAEEGLAMVFYPVKHLETQAKTRSLWDQLHKVTLLWECSIHIQAVGGAIAEKVYHRTMLMFQRSLHDFSLSLFLSCSLFFFYICSLSC